MAQDATPAAEGQTTPPPESKEGQAPPEPTTSEPKTFDADYVKQLRSEAAANRKARQEAEAKIAEYESANQSELEKLTGKLSKAEQAKADAEARLLRYEVATEKQIPADALDLLTGNTREELEAKADKLLSLVKNQAPEPDFDGGARDPAPDTESPESAHDKLALALIGNKH